MKSLPLSNRRTANPSETSKRPVDLSTKGSSSTRQTISEEGFSLGVMRICVTVPFSIWDVWDVAIMPYVSPDRSAGYWTLVVWTLVLCGIAGHLSWDALTMYSVRAGSRRCFVSQVRVAECAMNHLEKLFVIKRLNQESDCADLHREDPRGGIFVSCDHDDMSLRRYSA